MKSNLIEKCKTIISSLTNLNEEYLEIYPPIVVSEIRINNLSLPLDYCTFLNWSNGFSVGGIEVLGINNGTYDLIKTTNSEQNETNNLMPTYMIPYSAAGNGDYYCFNLKNGLDNNGTCPIVYWQWNYSTHKEYDKVNNSFIEWIEEWIEELKKEIANN